MKEPLIIFQVINDVYDAEITVDHFRNEADAWTCAEKEAIAFSDGDETLLEEVKKKIYVKRISVK